MVLFPSRGSLRHLRWRAHPWLFSDRPCRGSIKKLVLRQKLFSDTRRNQAAVNNGRVTATKKAPEGAYIAFGNPLALVAQVFCYIEKRGVVAKQCYVICSFHKKTYHEIQ